MFPVTVTIHNLDQLRAIAGVLNGDAAPAAAPAAEPTKPATRTRAAKAETAAPAPAPAPAPAAPPVVAGPSAAAQAFLQTKIAGPLQDLCLKDYPKAEAILKGYGVERASLVPEDKLQEFSDKINEALDPGAAERKRLEALDKQVAPSKTSLF